MREVEVNQLFALLWLILATSFALLVHVTEIWAGVILVVLPFCFGLYFTVRNIMLLIK